MQNQTCPNRNNCLDYDYCGCDGCNNSLIDFNKPKKKLALVGWTSKRGAINYMNLVTDILSRGEKPIDIVYINWNKLIFETPHVEVRFFVKGDRSEWLTGLRADAIFGREYPEMLIHAKPDAYINSKYKSCLTMYIRQKEREATESRKVMELGEAFHEGFIAGIKDITMPPRNGKSLYRHVLNAVYGKSPDRSLNDYIPNIQLALYAALMKGEKTMPEEVKTYINQDIATTVALVAAMREVTDRQKKRPNKLPGIKNVHFSGPCTVVIWEDKTKTVVRCKDDEKPDYEKGLAMAIAKKALGTNKSGSNYYDIFKKWLPKPEEEK